MAFRLPQRTYNRRIPVSLKMRNGYVYIQMQSSIVDESCRQVGGYCEFFSVVANAEDVGKAVLAAIAQFHRLGDLTVSELFQITELSMEEYTVKQAQDRLIVMGAKNEEDLRRNYDGCFLLYDFLTHKYTFGLSFVYREGRKYWNDSSPSTGEKGILTFDVPLEFDDSITPERLGWMVLEAFDRSRKMAARMSGDFCPAKTIELLEGSVVEVSAPQDRHFVDFDDGGVGELYQVYSYLAKDGADSSADFYLSVAPEIYGTLTCENVRLAWEKAYGQFDSIDVREVYYGIYTVRAEMKNKQVHRIAYFTALSDGMILECCMNLPQPNRRKKLDEVLTAIFEKFAIGCKFVKS